MHSVGAASPGAGRQVVAVTSDQALVAQAVAAAFSDRLTEAVVLPWPGTRPGSARRGARPPVGLLLSDLDAVATLDSAQLAMADPMTRWVVLTVAPAGPLWGAMAEAGAVAVLPSAMGLVGVRDRLRLLVGGDVAPDPGLRAHVASWRRYGAAQSVAAGRAPLLASDEAALLAEVAAGAATPRAAPSADAATQLLTRAVRRLGVRGVAEAVQAYRLAERLRRGD